MNKPIITLLACGILLAAQRTHAQDATVTPVPLPPSYRQADGVTLKVNGMPVPILQAIVNRRRHETYDIASFAFTGTAKVEITADKFADGTKLLPTGYGIRPTVTGNTISFNLNRPRHLYVQLPGRNPLLIFADAPGIPEPSPGANTFDVVARYKADATGKTESTAAIQQAINDAAVRGGTVLVPRGLFRSRKLTLKSNVRLHLAGGAALKFVDVNDDGMVFNKRQGPGLYFLTVDNARNVAVTGAGLLDCNGDKTHGSDNKRRLVSAFHSAQVTGLTLEGITILDSSSWTVVPAFSRQVLIRNIKIINTLALYENDGIDPVSCQDVLVDHCFVLATDDAFCPKPGGAGTHGGGCKPGPAIELRDVVFNDCLTWTGSAAFKLGRQSGTPALNIVCKNSHVINASRACAIDHDGGAAPFRNVLFQDIHVEGAIKHAPLYIETADPGPTTEVTYERVNLRVTGRTSSSLAGKDDVNSVSHVRFIDCTFAGNPVTDAKSLKLRLNKFVKDVSFTSRAPAQRPAGRTLTAVWGTHLIEAPAAAAVPVRPAVLVTDTENRPIPGVEVPFTVESGGGTVTDGTAATDAKGIATAGGWTLGRNPGVNTLIARGKDATGSYVVFRTLGKAEQ